MIYFFSAGAKKMAAQKNLNRMRAGKRADQTRKKNLLAKQRARSQGVVFRKNKKGDTIPIHINKVRKGAQKIQARHGATLKVQPKGQIQKTWVLKDFGYAYSKGERVRHDALDKLVKKVGAQRVVGLLQQQTHADPKQSRTFKDDLAYVRGKFSPAPKPVYVPTKPKHAPIVATFESQSTPGRKYYVTKNAAGHLQCNCPGYIYRRYCHHVEEAHNKTGITIAG